MYVIHHLLRVLRRVAGALCCAGLGLVSLSAHAFDPYPDFTFSPGGGGMTGVPSRGSAAAWTAGTKTPTSTGMMFSSAAKNLPFEPPTTGSFKMLFTPKNLGKAMTTGAAVAIPLVAGDVLSTLLGAACVRVLGGAMQLAPGGQWEECHFVNQTVLMYIASGDDRTKSLSEQQSCALYASYHYGSGYTGTARKNDPSAGYLDWCDVRQTSTGFVVTGVGIGKQFQTNRVQDGWQPSTADNAEQKIDDALAAWAASDFSKGDYSSLYNLQKVLEQLYKAGQPVEGTVVQPQIETPVTSPKTQTVTQTSDGTQTQTETQTKYDYSCIVIQNGQAVQCSQTSTTTSTTTATDPAHPASSPASSTSTTTTAVDPSKQQDPCAVNKNRLGCAEFGTPSDGDPLQKDTKNITFTPATFQGGSCPGPISFTAFGRGYSISYDVLCAKLATIKVLVLVLCGAAAAYIFADGFRV